VDDSAPSSQLVLMGAPLARIQQASAPPFAAGKRVRGTAAHDAGVADEATGCASGEMRDPRREQRWTCLRLGAGIQSRRQLRDPICPDFGRRRARSQLLLRDSFRGRAGAGFDDPPHTRGRISSARSAPAPSDRTGGGRPTPWPVCSGPASAVAGALGSVDSGVIRVRESHLARRWRWIIEVG
jgi:hypothetical protein